MTKTTDAYFHEGLPVQEGTLGRDVLAALVREHAATGRPAILYFRHLAPLLPEPVTAGFLHLCAVHQEIQRCIIARHGGGQEADIMVRAASAAGFPPGSPPFMAVGERFCRLFPGLEFLTSDEPPLPWLAADTPATGRAEAVTRELFLLSLAAENPALDPCRQLLDDRELAQQSPYRSLVQGMEEALTEEGPVAGSTLSLPELLRAPVRACPTSLPGQLAFMRDRWRHLLPPELLDRLQTSLDLAEVEASRPQGGAGLAQVLRFGKSAEADSYPEYERYSADTEWMPNVVMVAKMTYVWLDQLGKSYGRPVERLDQIPDQELDRLARWGFTALWLIGVWERSPASRTIKQLCGNPDAMASAYSLYDYEMARELGGQEALADLRQRCSQRGIRLASDMVPNHTGLHSRWIVEHPDWFVQLDYPPYPAYAFNGPDLSSSPEVSIHLDDGYWDKRDAAVVFKHYDHRDGRSRYIYHGNDGTSTPWNDTAQLNYLLPAVRQAVMDTILHVARLFPIIRFDAAMTLAKKHYQRLWFPQPGHGGVPSRAEHGMSREEFDAAFPQEFWREVVDRVAVEAPGTLLLAEAFWLMEGYFVRTLGMHRVYNSAFMNMLKMEENAKYRQTLKNVLEFDHRILQRFVNFMNNPDERTAVEQFGKEDKYLGACVMLVTMPGLPMFGHGQVEGFHEKYGMEYRRACWDEPVDEHLVWLHESRVFPLMKRRWIFSGSENFVLYDFAVDNGVDENVFAYSNRSGDEGALVLFNNHFGSSRGRVRDSAAFTVSDDGGSRLERTTLARALGFEADSRSYYLFRDASTGLEYLRAGARLAQEGFTVELGAYQHHVFLDFRLVLDDEFGNWGRLCWQMDGEPVADMAAELRQVRYALSIEAFRELLEACIDGLAGFEEDRGLAGQALETLQAPFSRFCDVFAAETGAVRCTGDNWRRFAKLLATHPCPPLGDGLPSPGAASPLPAPPLSGRSRLLLMAYALFISLESTEEGNTGGAMRAGWLGEYGLDRHLTEAFRSQKGGSTAGEPDPEEATLLLLAMLEAGDILAEARNGAELFTAPDCATFVKLHESDGVHWFNRERFEMLLGWAALTAAWQEEGTKAFTRWSIWGAAMALRARKTEYRLDRFLEAEQTKENIPEVSPTEP